MAALIISLTWFIAVITVANSMTIMAAGTVQLNVINCGDDTCDYPYETNTNCVQDCHCGDGYCYSGYEDCNSCPTDCDICPIEEPSRPKPIPPAPPVPPSMINVTLDIKGEPTIHIFARFKVPTAGAEANVTQISCEILEEMLYDYEIPYKCFLIRTENMPDSNLLEAFIISNIGKDWIDEFSIDPESIKVIRFYLNKRTTLPIGPIGEGDNMYWMKGYDPDFLYFLSATQGFTGFFLIVGEPIIPKPPVIEKPQPYCGDQICDATIGEGCMACPTDCGCTPGYACISNECMPDCVLFGMNFGKFLEICWYWWIVITTIIIILIYLIWKRRRRSLWWLIFVLLAIAILIALLAVRVRRKKKSRWQRFLDGINRILESLE